jgi:hypothetical protein
MKVPCASFVLTSNTPIRPAARSAETSSTNGARGGAFRARTTRSGECCLVGALAGDALAADALGGALVAGPTPTPSMAASASVTSVNGSALTRPA